VLGRVPSVARVIVKDDKEASLVGRLRHSDGLTLETQTS
jgi:hypothetical protein